jgi:hypothetical protein
MKITTNNIGIHSAEQSYKNFEHKIRQDEPVKQQQDIQAATNADKPDKTPAPEQIAPQKIFSNQELATLKALFGYESKENFTLYGKNRLHHANAGMLLDVKG